MRDRLSKGMAITGVTGLTGAQKSSLQVLGAVEAEGVGRSSEERSSSSLRQVAKR